MNLYIYKYDIGSQKDEPINAWVAQLNEYFIDNDIDAHAILFDIPTESHSAFKTQVKSGSIPDLASFKPELTGNFIGLCEPSSELAKNCRAYCSICKWGLSIPTSHLAYVYNLEDGYTLWHEAFHLYGADDCYKVDNTTVR